MEFQILDEIPRWILEIKYRAGLTTDMVLMQLLERYIFPIDSLQSILTKKVSNVTFFLFLLVVNSCAKFWRFQRNFRKLLLDYSPDSV